MADELERIRRFRLENGLDPDPEHARLWLAQLGRTIVPLPNFSWRRAAITLHDANHLRTGYATDFTGELRLAAWEMGRRCYVSLYARALCLMLTSIGLIADYRQTIRAYKAGCAARLTAPG